MRWSLQAKQQRQSQLFKQMRHTSHSWLACPIPAVVHAKCVCQDGWQRSLFSKWLSTNYPRCVYLFFIGPGLICCSECTSVRPGSKTCPLVAARSHMERGGYVLSSTDCTCRFVLVSFKASCRKSVLKVTVMFTKKRCLPDASFQHIFRKNGGRDLGLFVLLKNCCKNTGSAPKF